MAKKLHYDFQNTPSLSGHAVSSPDLTLTRATSACMVDADGYIRKVQSGEPRFKGATWRANLGPYSNTLSNGIFVKLNSAVAQNETGYDGTTNDAWTVTADGLGAGIEFCGVRWDAVTSSVTRGKTYLMSFYAKPGTKSWAVAYNSSATGVPSVWFNLSGAGSVGTQDAGILDAGIESVGSQGFYRCWFVIDDTNDNNSLYLSAADGDNVDGMDNTGSAEDAMIVQNFQIEDVSSRVSPSPYTYIETTAAAVTELSGTSEGLMVEEARTNLCLQSEDFSTSWTAGAETGTIGTNVAIAPDGSLTADRIIDDSAGGTGNDVEVRETLSTPSDGIHTTSVFVKADGAQYMRLSQASVVSLDLHVSVDLSDGSIITTGADNSSAGVEDYGNGWYRVWVAWDSTGDAGSTISINVASSSGGVVVNRDGTSSIFVWGAQLEVGAFPTSYIPTTTASVTRNRDEFPAVSFSANNPAGTLYAEYADLHAAVRTTSWICGIADSATGLTDYLHLLARNTDGLQTNLVSSAGDDATLEVSSVLGLTPVKAALGYAEDDVELYVDGVRAGTGDQTYDPSTDAYTHFRIASRADGSTTNQMSNGLIAEIRYYDERLDNTALENMSLGVFPAEFSLVWPRDAMPTLGRTDITDFITSQGYDWTSTSLNHAYKLALGKGLGLTDAESEARDLPSIAKDYYDNQ